MITRVIKKFKFWVLEPRIGPDMPLTHWLLYFKGVGYWLCKKKLGKLGENSSVRPGVYVVAADKIKIGDNVTLRPGSMLHADPRENGAGIIIEDKVLIGSSVHIYVDTHKFDETHRPIFDQGFYPSKEVRLLEGCWIGANAVILPGITIGKNSIVGASSVVTKDIPDFCVAVGNPAKVIKRLV